MKLIFASRRGQALKGERHGLDGDAGIYIIVQHGTGAINIH